MFVRIFLSLRILRQSYRKQTYICQERARSKGMWPVEICWAKSVFAHLRNTITIPLESVKTITSDLDLFAPRKNDCTYLSHLAIHSQHRPRRKNALLSIIHKSAL